MINTLYAPLETKFVDGSKPGEFSGYASVYGNVDSHGDVVAPKAFDQGLSELKAAGRSVPMHLMHRVYGGDGLPVGVWTKIEGDDKGLRVWGKISGMNTDYGQRVHALVQDGALGGLSIGFRVRPDGAVIGKKAGEPKRTLTGVDLKEISLVDSPSNALTRVDQIKSALMDEFKEMMKFADVSKATAATVAAFVLHDQHLSGNNSPTSEERAAMRSHLQDIHEALTGQRSPPGMKSVPTTIRELETFLREECKFSHAQARSFVENGFKVASPPRDEGNDPTKKAAELLNLLKTG